MKHLGISGGSTKISGLTGAAETLILEKHYKPDIISGISAGAIIALPIALGLWDELIKVTTSFSLDTIFSKKPLDEKGDITFGGIRRILAGKESLGEHFNLVNVLKEIIPADLFEEYTKNDCYPSVWIGAVDFVTYETKFFNLKTVSYIDYLKIILGSSAMPVYTPSSKYDDMFLFDGGVVFHIGTPWVLENIPNITESVSIFSRSENYEQCDNEWEPSTMFSVAKRYVEMNLVNVSRMNEMLENLLCEKLNIKQTKIFLPIHLDGMYDVNRQRILNMYNIGKLSVEKYYKHE